MEAREKFMDIDLKNSPRKPSKISGLYKLVEHI